MSAPAKPEAAAAKPGAKPDAAAPGGEAAPAAGGGAKSLLPVILAVVLAPAITWATVEFVLVPRLQKKIAAAAPQAAHAAGEHGEAAPAHAAPPPAKPEKGKPDKGGKDAKGGPAAGYEFTNVVVNLSGTMGTRYLKTSFLITGSDPALKSTFEGQKPKLTDVTLNVLSSLTLADLEEAGAKNILREKLVNAYNQALGRKVAEQVYFSDFVVQ
ncbi:MAG: flagellar basal body-associated FliL family protein [Opitutaceae bacterium]|nr:flagellar basal body-associated FliL family protein [Opitutaceae bacterium]